MLKAFYQDRKDKMIVESDYANKSIDEFVTRKLNTKYFMMLEQRKRKS